MELASRVAVPDKALESVWLATEMFLSVSGAAIIRLVSVRRWASRILEL